MLGPSHPYAQIWATAVASRPKEAARLPHHQMSVGVVCATSSVGGSGQCSLKAVARLCCACAPSREKELGSTRAPNRKVPGSILTNTAKRV